MPIGVLADHDDVGDRLAPGQLVAVVLVRAEEHDRSLRGRYVPAELVAVLQLGWDAQTEDADEFVDRPGAARAGEDDDRLLVTADRLGDERPGVLAQPAGLQAGVTGLGVGVGVAGEHLVPDEVLDERQRPAGSGVVGVGHPPRAVWPGQHLVVTDDRITDLFSSAVSTGAWTSNGEGYPRVVRSSGIPSWSGPKTSKELTDQPGGDGEPDAVPGRGPRHRAAQAASLCWWVPQPNRACAHRIGGGQTATRRARPTGGWTRARAAFCCWRRVPALS